MGKKKNGKSQESRRLLQEQLRQMEPVELIDELDAKIEGMTEYDFDTELVKDYMAVLREKTPLDMDGFDAEQSFNEFREKYALQYEAAISEPAQLQAPKRRFRVAGIIAAAACMVFVILFSAKDAYGNSYLYKIVHWGEEVLSFRQLPPGGIMTLPTDSGSEYRSIVDALEQNGLSSANCPTWIPAGFSLADIIINENDISTQFAAVYVNSAEQKIRFLIHCYDDHSTIMSVEKDPAGFIYQSGNLEYYLLENMSVSKAVWEDDAATYQIVGDISMDDLQVMINSIQERR